MHATCYAHLILLDFITLIISYNVQVLTSLIMQFSPVSCYFLLFRSKYFPQHLALKRPQSEHVLPLMLRDGKS
jgi:accessory gene regulator protein AgrB